MHRRVTHGVAAEAVFMVVMHAAVSIANELPIAARAGGTLESRRTAS
jgi:hypothetical protein